jgi:TIR domain
MFQYDVFLSHAADDKDEVDRVRLILLEAKFRVYCDRHDDRQLDRSKVSAATANTLKDRMRRCNAMVYVATRRAPVSKWMPWELGFFDGVRGKILIYPVDEAALKAARNQEYLSLFKILKPGRLAEQLKHELDDPMGVFHELIDQPFFAKADEAMTAAYGKRLSEIRPPDLGRMTRLQNEMWRAWLRLWGIST